VRTPLRGGIGVNKRLSRCASASERLEKSSSFLRGKSNLPREIFEAIFWSSGKREIKGELEAKTAMKGARHATQ